jgi:glycosyltransferase involved in cell wall biosynthesis
MQLILDEKFHEAKIVLSELYKKNPDSLDLLRSLILVNRKIGQDKSVLRLCKKYLKHVYLDAVAIDLIRSLRALDRADEIEPSLAKFEGQTNINVRAELARNQFFCGHFKVAIKQAEALLIERPGHRQSLVIATSAAIELKKYKKARHFISQFHDDEINIQAMETHLFEYAANYSLKDYDAAIKSLNKIYAFIGCQNIKIQNSKKRLTYDVLEPANKKQGLPKNFAVIDGPPPIYKGPLVSICMTTYNAEQYVETSVRSLQQQSYKNIEIIISDDCSTDDTPNILRALAKGDPRIKLNLKTTNDGTYVSKNMAILQATGTYIALQDSDDWSHPDRIAKSISTLEAYPKLIGLSTDWFRMDTSGRLIIKAGGQISHVCCISFVFRRQAALDSAGLFDSVRIEADMEYIRRLTLIHGQNAIARLRWPLLIGRAHEESLTANVSYGITRTGFTKPRLDYQKSYKAWHDEIRMGVHNGFMPFPLSERIYKAPNTMLPDRKKA